MREAGLTLNRGKAVKRKLFLGNALLCGIKVAKLKAESSTAKKQILQEIASGNTIGRYSGLKWLGRKTEINRNRSKLGHNIQLKKWIDIGTKSRRKDQERYRQAIVSFFKEVTTGEQPGKADVN